MAVDLSYDFSNLTYDEKRTLIQTSYNDLYNADGYPQAENVVDVAKVLGVNMAPGLDTVNASRWLHLILLSDHSQDEYLNGMASVITGELV